MPWRQARLRVAPAIATNPNANIPERIGIFLDPNALLDLPFATMLDGSAIPDGQSIRQGDARRAGAAPHDRK